jgi:hypothetical protein
MRGFIVFVLMASTAQGSSQHCVPVQRVQKARVVVQKNHAQKVVQYAAPQVQKYVERVVVNHHDDYAQSYSGLHYDNGLDYQYRVGQALRDDIVADKVYAKLVADGTLAALILRAQAESLKAIGTVNPQSPSPESVAPVSNLKAQNIHKNSCVKCHSGADPDAGIDFSNADSIDALTRWKAYNATLTGNMPQGSKPLVDEEVDVLREWAASSK